MFYSFSTTTMNSLCTFVHISCSDTYIHTYIHADRQTDRHGDKLRLICVSIIWKFITLPGRK